MCMNGNRSAVINRPCAGSARMLIAADGAWTVRRRLKRSGANVDYGRVCDLLYAFDGYGRSGVASAVRAAMKPWIPATVRVIQGSAVFLHRRKFRWSAGSLNRWRKPKASRSGKKFARSSSGHPFKSRRGIHDIRCKSGRVAGLSRGTGVNDDPIQFVNSRRQPDCYFTEFGGTSGDTAATEAGGASPS